MMESCIISKKIFGIAKIYIFRPSAKINRKINIFAETNIIMPKTIIASLAKEAINKLYGTDIDIKQLAIQPTRPEIEGDFTLVVFPITKISKKNPADTAEDIGKYITDNTDIFSKYEVIKGFLNFTLKTDFWADFINKNAKDTSYGNAKAPTGKRILIEFSSPNTNKPLHLGHVRNNLLGMSVSNILQANGDEVIKVNLVNDRGIHICKSMIAWQKYGNGETPETAGKKGDHLIGDYYVEFNNKYQEEVKDLVSHGMSKEEAEEKALIMQETHQMLQKWEAGDKDTIELWKMMNSWVYDGFDKTYKRLGITFDKTFYESETYLLGKQNVYDALDKGLVTKDPDNSIWIDLTDEGLDRKILLRKDGTSVYITQDIGTAITRHEQYSPDRMVYVVGNEQLYHFDVLKLTLKKFGYDWADIIYHLSYGMVELTTGKMKSREGTVVDADDLMDEMHKTAAEMIGELGKVQADSEQADSLAEMIGLAALKYFVLKVDPKKDMLFNPKESIDFNGNTGPFIQYSYARIQSILSKVANDKEFNPSDLSAVPSSFNNFNESELDILKTLHSFPETIAKAAEDFNPAIVANYSYELAKQYNHFYQDINILKEQNPEIRNMRLLLSFFVANTIKHAMNLLGIDVPNRM